MRGKLRFLNKIAMFLYRSSAEPSIPNVFVWGALGVCLVGLGAMFWVALGSYFVAWENLHSNVPIQGDWKVVYQSNHTVCEYDVVNKNCLANPSNQTLWQSSFHRSDSDYQKRVNDLNGKDFWLGLEIKKAELKKAYINRASHFLIGWIIASYRVWVDGKLILTGNKKTADPIKVDFNFENLNKSQNVKIAIQVIHDSDAPYPDYFTGSFVHQGFFTSENYDLFSKKAAFLSQIKPFSLFFANLILCSLCFLLWWVTPQKREYLHIGFLLALGASMQLSYSDFFSSSVDREFMYLLDTLFYFFNALFLFSTGCAFARVKKYILFYTALPLIAFVGYALSLKPLDSNFYYKELIGKYFVPMASLGGAVVCIIQAFYLYTNRTHKNFLPKRIKALLGFSLCLLGVSVYYYVASAGLVSKSNYVYIHSFFNFFLLFLMVQIVFREYKNEQAMLKTNPVSEYHRRPVLPESVSGVVLLMDLKFSEIYYRHRSQDPDSEDIVSLWRSLSYNMITKHGGTVISKKGDEILTFFDNEKSHSFINDTVLAAVNALKDIQDAGFRLIEDLLSSGQYPQEAKGFYFRAAISQGQIRPIWEDVGIGLRQPEWVEAGSTSPFVETARLMEFEKKINTVSQSSMLIVQDALAKTYENKLSFEKRNIQLQDKHGKSYFLSSFTEFKANQNVFPLKRKQAA